MAVPKNRTSQARSRRRRTINMRIMNIPNVSECSNCGDLKLPHRICSKCGYYKGREVLNMQNTKSEE